MPNRTDVLMSIALHALAILIYKAAFVQENFVRSASIPQEVLVTSQLVPSANIELDSRNADQDDVHARRAQLPIDAEILPAQANSQTSGEEYSRHEESPIDYEDIGKTSTSRDTHSTDRKEPAILYVTEFNSVLMDQLVETGYAYYLVHINGSGWYVVEGTSRNPKRLAQRIDSAAVRTFPVAKDESYRIKDLLQKRYFEFAASEFSLWLAFSESLEQMTATAQRAYADRVGIPMIEIDRFVARIRILHGRPQLTVVSHKRGEI